MIDPRKTSAPLEHQISAPLPLDISDASVASGPEKNRFSYPSSLGLGRSYPDHYLRCKQEIVGRRAGVFLFVD